MNVDEYLNRINSANLRENSLQNLFRLQQNHLLNVPFENLDINFKKNGLETDTEAIYNKIVKNSRGGISFELNQLFAWLLKQLGYQVDMLSCITYDTQLNIWQPWCTHIVLMVNMFESSYLVDVGFDFNYRHPLKFELDKIQPDVTGHYNLIKDDECEDTFIVIKCYEEDIFCESAWSPLYKFNISPIRQQDRLAELIENYLANRKNEKITCAIHTTHTILNLNGCTLSETKFSNSAEKSKKHSQLTNSEVNDAIKNIFGIRIDADVC
jgi:N-hydroxyarylamine O-acetyltransferase